MTKALEFVSQSEHPWNCGINAMLDCTCGRDQAIKLLSKASEDTEMLDWLEKSYLSTEFWIKLGGESDIRNAIRQAMKGNKG